MAVTVVKEEVVWFSHVFIQTFIDQQVKERWDLIKVLDSQPCQNAGECKQEIDWGQQTIQNAKPYPRHVLQELNEKKDSEYSRWTSSHELEKPGGGRFNKLW